MSDIVWLFIAWVVVQLVCIAGVFVLAWLDHNPDINGFGEAKKPSREG